MEKNQIIKLLKIIQNNFFKKATNEFIPGTGSNFYFKKEKITNWLDKNKVKNYTLIPDERYGYVVNVDGPVNLTLRKLKSIPVKFNIVSGLFYCSNNNLVNLEGCPIEVGSEFDCSFNKLTTLLGAPSIVKGKFECSHNDLISLEHSPIVVGEDFNCYHNSLESLVGAPQIISGIFGCSFNKLTNLIGSPKTTEQFVAMSNSLTNLEGISKNINGHLLLAHNSIDSLIYCPEFVKGNVNLSNNSNRYESIDNFKQMLEIHGIEKEKIMLESNFISTSENISKVKAAANKKTINKI